MRTCEIDGCDKKHYARGMCVSHYYSAHWKRHPGRRKQYRTNYYQRNRERIIAENKQWADEHPVEREAIVMKSRIKQNSKKRNKYQEMRAKLIQHYGGGCACCGENYPEFLALDHINGNGNQHRKTVGRGWALLNWIVENNYPPIFRVLCHNCNQSLGLYGYCPHNNETH